MLLGRSVNFPVILSLTKMAVFDLRREPIQNSEIAIVTLDGNDVASSIHEEIAVDRASVLLNCTIRLVGGKLYCEGYPAYPDLPLDFQQAKAVVAARMLFMPELDLGAPVEIDDDKCVRYEWGWVMHWKTSASFSCGQFYRPYLVDRITSICWFAGGTLGLEHGILELLRKRPRNLCDPYPYLGDRDCLRPPAELIASGAFKPLA